LLQQKNEFLPIIKHLTQMVKSSTPVHPSSSSSNPTVGEPPPPPTHTYVGNPAPSTPAPEVISILSPPPPHPHTTPFSPSSSSRRAASEELPDWLLSSPSSSEGRSPSLGHFSGHRSSSSLADSFADVVHNKGKALVEAGGPDPKGKALTESSRARSGHPMPSGLAPRPTPVGFMVDAHRAQQSVVPHPHPPERQPVDKDGGW
jgi:hypothetical protein